MRPARMTGAMAIPLEHVHDLHSMTKALTAKHQPMGAEDATLVEAFRFADDCILVPRQFGLDYCQRNHILFEDHTSAGFAIECPRTPIPRDYQQQPLTEIVDAFEAYYDFIFRAHTGWGKTVGGLYVAAQIASTTLVIVDQDNLKDQWLKALADHFGMTIDNGHVGIVQGTTCDYQGKSVVIAMVQTLSQKQFEPEFYAYFGLVLFDEVHTVGAPTFSVVLLDFAAARRLGMSATPKRKDSLQKLLDYSLGKVRVAADKEHDESAVYFRDHPTIYSWYANISPKVGRVVNEVTEDASRNLLLAESALDLYETGRDGLILSDRIEQLKHLISLLYYLGADPDQLGLYAGYNPTYRYAKDPAPARKPNYLVAHAESGQAEYTPVSLQLIAKRIPKKQLASTPIGPRFQAVARLGFSCRLGHYRATARATSSLAAPDRMECPAPLS